VTAHPYAKFRRILVPLDGSTLAEEALSVAGPIAHRVGAEIHLMSVQSPALSAGAKFGLADTDTQPVYGDREHIEAYLAMMAARLARTEGVHAVPAVLEGSPPELLSHYIKAAGIDLVVMTTHGRGGFGRLCLGSVANELLRRVTVPVLLLRHGAHPEGAAFRRIVVALDGTPQSERSLGPALALGTMAAEVHYTLVRVIQPVAPMVTPVGLYPPPDGEPIEQLAETAGKYLEEMADWLRSGGGSVDARVLVGQAADEIVSFAAKDHSQLIVVGTRAARGMDRLLQGSVADLVMRSAGQPVLIVPPDRKAADLRQRPEESATVEA
jgi:nucleotide-binding universal stress UspA family protein